MPYAPSQVQLGPVPVNIWGGANGVSVLVVNQDTINTVTVAYNTNITVGALNAVSLGPGQSVSLDGSERIYACAPAGSAPLAIIPGGSSFFQPTTLSNIGGISCFVQDTVPVPAGGSTYAVNSVWFNESTESLYTWNDSTWIQQAFNAQELLTAGTIVGGLIAAGTIVAGMVDGTTIEAATFQGNNFIINSDGIFFYNI